MRAIRCRAVVRRALTSVGATVVLVVLVALTTGRAGATTPPYGTSSNDALAGCPAGTAQCPSSDPFYQPPANLASLRDGTLIGMRPATVAEAGLQSAKAAYTISFRSEDAFGAPVLDTATVLLPSAPYAGLGSQPLVSVQFAEDSLGAQCQPSYALAHPNTNGNVDAESSNAGALLAQGYVVVAPDFDGPAEQFIVGQQEGHAVLDGLRAARSLPAAGLTRSTPVAMTGYSGGAHATGWAAEFAAGYAPDLNVVGAAEGGTPADLAATGRSLNGSLFFGLSLLSSQGLDRGFPATGIYAALNARGRSVYARTSTDCVGQAATAFPGQSFDDYTTTPDVTDTPPLRALLLHEQLGQTAPQFPILNYHVVNDEIVPFAQDVSLVKYYCQKSTPVQFAALGGDHISGEAAATPLVEAFLRARFSGITPANDCAAVAALPGSASSVPDSSGGGAGTGTAARPPSHAVIRLAVRPSRLTARRLVQMRFRATARVSGHLRPVAAARITVAGRVARTNRRGDATITTTFRRPGRYRARAHRAGFIDGTAMVYVRRPLAARFTG